jgi:hypothetical protein
VAWGTRIIWGDNLLDVTNPNLVIWGDLARQLNMGASATSLAWVTCHIEP